MIENTREISDRHMKLLRNEIQNNLSGVGFAVNKIARMPFQMYDRETGEPIKGKAIRVTLEHETLGSLSVIDVIYNQTDQDFRTLAANISFNAMLEVEAYRGG